MLYLFFRLGAKGQAFGSSIANESLAEWHVDSYAGFDARVPEFHSCKSADEKIELSPLELLIWAYGTWQKVIVQHH